MTVIAAVLALCANGKSLRVRYPMRKLRHSSTAGRTANHEIHAGSGVTNGPQWCIAAPEPEEQSTGSANKYGVFAPASQFETA
jgi:hypothetical protein